MIIRKIAITLMRKIRLGTSRGAGTWFKAALALVILPIPCVRADDAGHVADRTITARNFRAEAIAAKFTGSALPNGNMQMRLHHVFQPIHIVPVVLLALSGVKMHAAAGTLDYRTYVEPTCTGIGTADLACAGYDVVAESGAGTTIDQFEGTVLVMNVLFTPSSLKELPGRLE